MTNAVGPGVSNVQVLRLSVPRLSDALMKAIDDSLNLIPNAAGDLVWAPPAALSPGIVDEAKSVCAPFAAALEPASDAYKLRWLSQLEQLVSGATSPEEGVTRIRAMIRDLDHPALCFTDETRREAARRFKYLPAFADLAPFLDDVVRPHLQRLRRLKRIASMG